MNHLGHFYLCVSVPLDIIDNQDDVRGKYSNCLRNMTNYRATKTLLWEEQTREKDFDWENRCYESYNESVI
ncbi:14975_t:CDS:2 [Funneliformis caledonium]|uniref:14975_t:CDS:1 n=1 Tax=Funneliformis caledonium TaxID=1117310 RepID=A0A9N8ZMW9_9GLOM|nr:14975_t:CDS:2 [Funneliformis caledonium]